MEINNHTVVNFCLYYYSDSNDIYKKNFKRAYIQSNYHVKKDNKILHSCEKIDTKNWIKIDTFYAIDGKFIPIPSNMSLFCIKYNREKTKIIDVYKNYDVFKSEKNCIYFTTYSKKTINSRPLYFYKNNTGDIIPSFLDDKPTDNEDWEKWYTIYVMYKENNFECINGNIIQNYKSDKNLYQTLLTCNKMSIFDIVKDNVKDEKDEDNYSLIIRILLFLIFVLIIYLLYSQNKNEF